MIVAHRGASAQRAEHTLAAYELALEQGADGLECDVRLSRDGHLVCVHDRTVDRTSNGRGAVSALTLAQLSGFDYGGWQVHPAGPDERGLLTLDALLGLVRDTAPDTTLFVETKHPVRFGGLVEAKLVALLVRHGLARPAYRAESRVVVMSFSATAVRRVRQLAPLLPTVFLLNRMLPTMAGGRLPRWADLAGPGIHLLRADPGFVARCRSHGHDTYTWTVDDADDIALCRRLGVRYLATNSPADSRQLLAG